MAFHEAALSNAMLNLRTRVCMMLGAIAITATLWLLPRSLVEAGSALLLLALCLSVAFSGIPTSHSTLDSDFRDLQPGDFVFLADVAIALSSITTVLLFYVLFLHLPAIAWLARTLTQREVAAPAQLALSDDDTAMSNDKETTDNDEEHDVI
ncbi:hypothetical protein SPRG_17705 [Saprolegnia parasitica CBS 223.65]|uniref:Uncharacterized protein n=1 Tax=Saprolegnia parasitica (strain CBS 223.65) TaxID=695850 RepID=A0A067BQ60_SAPPC|nr:hypothetical protein SPRG_17705 [Saprolegnia parasitica CBS 223.65]KDO16807.1 hypothetical protein SPRG_17705 [Saprolegnia parasitica CBS 223.65]|eukprot:XP_012212483.1 hypothetical protein SPRG_17705 [Saprolegnia parasitica CBS 223.65]